MKKLTRKSLDELARVMPVIDKQSQRLFIGMGDGSSSNPYTQIEYECMTSAGYWSGGYVVDIGYVGASSMSGSEDDTAYGGVLSGVTVISYNPNDLPSTGVDSYDLMYRGGYAAGFAAGKSSSDLDDAAVVSGSILAAASAGSDFGDVNYDMIHYSQGLKDGLAAGKKAKEEEEKANGF